MKQHDFKMIGDYKWACIKCDYYLISDNCPVYHENHVSIEVYSEKYIVDTEDIDCDYRKIFAVMSE